MQASSRPRWFEPRLEKFSNTRRGHCTLLTRYLAAVFKDRHRWNRGDSKARSERRHLFGVHLYHYIEAGTFRCDLGNFRRNHFAGAAPWRPEVHQDRQHRLPNQRIKRNIIADIDWPVQRPDLPVAFTAPERSAQPFVQESIALATVRAARYETTRVCFDIAHQQSIADAPYRFRQILHN